MNQDTREALQRLPSVDEAVRRLEAGATVDAVARGGQAPLPPPRWALIQAVREGVAELRAGLIAGVSARTELDLEALHRRAAALCRPSLRPVLNATGVVLHTNLGRAPLAATVIERLAAVASGYSNLEYLLGERRRGNRHVHASSLLRQLCEAEDAMVVNNNAAAVMLTLAALAHGREVVVSRGELIEIGGSFRLPEVMAASGALLREVGATNRTHLRDYERAIGPETALLLKAHRSNFAVVGFTAEVSPEELTALGRERGIPTLFDLGSGSLLPLSELGLPDEPTVQEALRAGFDLVCFSGDKLLGGPQAGMIVGRAELCQRLKSHPLMRPLRPDKLTLAALEATLEIYRDGGAREALPALRMLAATEAELRQRARRLRTLLRKQLDPGFELELTAVVSQVGGGALPLAEPRSWAVAIGHTELGPDQIEARLRAGDPPVIGTVGRGTASGGSRRQDPERLLLDVRTLFEKDLPRLASAAGRALAGAGTLTAP
jgi:L-seryl-tRNA(Ser) seleniumtransferase